MSTNRKVFFFLFLIITSIAVIRPSVAADTKKVLSSAKTLEERVNRLEEKLDLIIALKDESIKTISERSDKAFKLLECVGVLAAGLLVFFSIRDIILRREEWKRQQSIDGQQFAAVQNVNSVIEVVQQTLAFRLQQERSVAEAFQEITRIKNERERIKEQKVTQAHAILEHFKKMSRMQFAALTDEQYKRGTRLKGLVNDLDDLLEEHDSEDMGDLLYTCGIIGYYDNDVIEAKTYLDRAARCRASDHEGELITNDSYRNKFAFIHYFRALIHKNWGDLSEAQHEIEQSVKLLETQESEFLTPVTKAEILSYIVGDEMRCRIELEKLVERINALEASLKNGGKELNTNQLRLHNRMLVIWGNTYFQGNSFKEALDKYNMAVELNSNDYYALASAAQCFGALGNNDSAEKYYRQSLDAIERSGDFRKKRERITRAVIAVTASNAAKYCGDSKYREQYAQDARELLSGNLTVDGMSPKFFSPATKRLVSATELLNELDS